MDQFVDWSVKEDGRRIGVYRNPRNRRVVIAAATTMA